MDISNRAVQYRRSRKTACDLNLHDYVPLFIAEKTPMMYKLKDDPEIVNYNVIVIKPSIFFREGVCFSDRNAAVYNANFYTNTEEDKFKNLDWNLLRSGFWDHMNPVIKDIQKKQISAEILVPHYISTDWFQKIISYKDAINDFFFE